MDSTSIGTTIRRLRMERDIGQKVLAQHLRITVSAVSNWETGRRLPSIEEVRKMAAFFDVSLDAFGITPTEGLPLQAKTQEKRSVSERMIEHVMHDSTKNTLSAIFNLVGIVFIMLAIMLLSDWGAILYMIGAVCLLTGTSIYVKHRYLGLNTQSFRLDKDASATWVCDRLKRPQSWYYGYAILSLLVPMIVYGLTPFVLLDYLSLTMLIILSVWTVLISIMGLLRGHVMQELYIKAQRPYAKNHRYLGRRIFEMTLALDFASIVGIATWMLFMQSPGIPLFARLGVFMLVGISTLVSTLFYQHHRRYLDACKLILMDSAGRVIASL